MKDNFRDLLAGYATGTLSDAEKKALFEAALHDPELFAEIANEEPLRELLASPVARAELLERVEPAAPGFRERLAAWLRRPAVLSAAGVVAAGLVVLAVLPFVRNFGNRPEMVASIAPPASNREVAVSPMAAPPPVERQQPGGVVAAAAARKTAQALRGAPAQRPTPTPSSDAATGQVAGPIALARVAEAEHEKVESRGVHLAAPVDPTKGRVLSTDAANALVASHNAAVAPAMVALAPPPPPKAVNAREAPAPVRYEVETRGPAGEFAAAANASELEDGAVVRVRFRPAMSGLITVRDASTPDAEPIFSRLVTARSDATTEPIQMDRDRRLDVVFTPLSEARADEKVESAPARVAGGGMRASTIANGARRTAPNADASGRMAFSIELRRKP